MRYLATVILSTFFATVMQPSSVHSAGAHHDKASTNDCTFKYCSGSIVPRKTVLYRSLADGLKQKHPAHTVPAGGKVFLDEQIYGPGKEIWLRVARQNFIEGAVLPPHCDTTLYYVSMPAVSMDDGGIKIFQVRTD
jgi:hypothetical protein